MLGIPSLSVSPLGTHALYNTLEGLTCLWDLESGEVVGKHESYTRTAEQPEPGMFASISVRPANRLVFGVTAWSVSLHPDGRTYAATGGAGNVTIHSAETSNFGQQIAKLEAGRSKFGMFTAHVCTSFHHLCSLS